MDINDLTSGIIGAAIEVHRQLGPGLLESAYRVCLAYELRKRGFEVVEERPVPVVYDGVHLECGFRADLIVNNLVVVELKAKSALHPVDSAQTLSHLRLIGLRVGLLINCPKIGVRSRFSFIETCPLFSYNKALRSVSHLTCPPIVPR